MGRSLLTADTEEKISPSIFESHRRLVCSSVNGPTGHLLSSAAVKRTMD